MQTCHFAIAFWNSNSVVHIIFFSNYKLTIKFSHTFTLGMRFRNKLYLVHHSKHSFSIFLHTEVNPCWSGITHLRLHKHLHLHSDCRYFIVRFAHFCLHMWRWTKIEPGLTLNIQKVNNMAGYAKVAGYARQLFVKTDKYEIYKKKVL